MGALTTNGSSSRPRVFCKNVVLKNFSKFTGKHLCQSLFFNKVADRGIEHLRWLLLKWSIQIVQQFIRKIIPGRIVKKNLFEIFLVKYFIFDSKCRKPFGQDTSFNKIYFFFAKKTAYNMQNNLLLKIL